MYRFFLPIPEDAFGGRNYRFCILCMPSWLYIYNDIHIYCIILYIYTHNMGINIHICHYVNINVQYDATYDALSLYI